MFFDAANRQTCSVKTVTTNTPLHALVTLNDMTYVEAARALAQLALEKQHDRRGATELRVPPRYGRARPPTPKRRCSRRRWRSSGKCSPDRAAALQLLKVGDSPRNEKLDASEHAALAAVCLMMLNTRRGAEQVRPAMHPASERALLCPAGTSSAAPRPASARPRSRRCSRATHRPPSRKRVGGLPELPHFAPKAKRVIYLFQNGAPTHVDLFDYKPELTKQKGKQIPDSVVKGARFSTMTGGQTVRPCLPEITKFAQHGQSGAWVSDFLPHTARDRRRTVLREVDVHRRR